MFSIYLFYDDGAKRQIICCVIMLGPLNYWYLYKTVKQTHTHKINQNIHAISSSTGIVLENYFYGITSSPSVPSHIIIINFEIISFDRNQSMTEYMSVPLCIYR
jgi:hypothetical protein